MTCTQPQAVAPSPQPTPFCGCGLTTHLHICVYAAALPAADVLDWYQCNLPPSDQQQELADVEAAAGASTDARTKQHPPPKRQSRPLKRKTVGVNLLAGLTCSLHDAHCLTQQSSKLPLVCRCVSQQAQSAACMPHSTGPVIQRTFANAAAVAHHCACTRASAAGAGCWTTVWQLGD